MAHPTETGTLKPDATPSRDDLLTEYLDTLPYDPYPVQEEALLAWFTQPEGVLVCAPTGMGKTIIAEAALFEALHAGKTAYYTTPLIALTEQKFAEMQEAAVRWGFSADDVGLVTGNRRVNPDAKILVVVAEILLNRLLHAGADPPSADGGLGAAFDFTDVAAVVMDEFHSFNDPERGIVWELSLGLLPRHVRLLLLSATVGNAVDFQLWLRRSHNRKIQLVQGTERKVPLRFEWVGDELLNEHLTHMADGDDETRKTPALVFCFNRNECWSVAEQLKGKSLLASGQQKQLAEAIDQWDWKQGAGPKLKPLLMRGVGVHHAGLLPKYKRRVEELFQQKLLTVCVCTETLAAGLNLPARSVVLTSLIKGPFGKKKVIDPSSAHQMFGRAGRPQFDDEGFVYVLAHEDDVKIARWKEQYDQIPEDTKDPNLIRMKKKLKKKMPTRRTNQQYWQEEQFDKLVVAPPGKLSSRGTLPWRLLAYLLELSPDVGKLRQFIQKRMLDEKQLEPARKRLTQMLITLWAGGYVTLDPEPPPPPDASGSNEAVQKDLEQKQRTESKDTATKEPQGLFGAVLQEALETGDASSAPKISTETAAKPGGRTPPDDEPEPYQPLTATPTETLSRLLQFRSVNPLYGDFLVRQLGIADRAERIQAIESVLDVPGAIFKQVRAPGPDELPPGPLATQRLDGELLDRGLVTSADLDPTEHNEECMWDDRKWAVPFADKLRMLFDAQFPNVRDVRTRPVWIVGDLLLFGGDFNKYVTGRDLTKQEGLIFRHCLRMILLCGEFAKLCPPETTIEEWQTEWRDIADQLTITCRAVDPDSTDKTLESAAGSDPLLNP